MDAQAQFFFNYRLFHTGKKNLQIFIAITSDSLRYLVLFWLTISWWCECIASCHIRCLYCIWESDYLPSLNLDRCLFPGQLLSPEYEERVGPLLACFLSPQCVNPKCWTKTMEQKLGTCSDHAQKAGDRRRLNLCFGRSSVISFTNI